MPDLVISTINGRTIYSVRHITDKQREKSLGSELRIPISEAYAALPIEDLRKMVEAGIIA